MREKRKRTQKNQVKIDFDQTEDEGGAEHFYAVKFVSNWYPTILINRSVKQVCNESGIYWISSYPGDSILVFATFKLILR